MRLFGLWKQKQLVSRRLLGYDTTNFYTYIASTNTQNHLAQRGHNQQGRHNLRQVGLSYVLAGASGMDRSAALESGARGVARTASRTDARLQQRSAWSACRGRKLASTIRF